MKALWSAILVLTMCVMGLLPASAQDVKSAEAFVRTLYKRYQTEKDFNPFFEPTTVKTIATPALAALVKRDQALSAAAGEQSGLDADPVCGSQDPDKVRLVNLKIRPTDPGRAVAAVTVHSGTALIPRRLLLQTVGGGWRIDDITDGQGGSSIRASLLASIAASTPKHKR